MSDTPQTTEKFDVIATNLWSGKKRVLLRGYDKEAAEGAVKYAVIRRGADFEIFSAVPTGSVQE